MTIVKKLQELLSLSDTHLIIESYKQLLNREVDPTGYGFFSESITKNLNKLCVIKGILESDEFSNLLMDSTPNDPAKAIVNRIIELYQLENQQFIRKLYHELLEREPHEEELANQLKRLQFTTKQKLFVKLLYSTECQQILFVNQNVLLSGEFEPTDTEEIKEPSSTEEAFSLKCNWHSFVNFPFYGYTETSKNIMLALDRQQVDVRYQYVYGPGTILSQPESEQYDHEKISSFSKKPYDPSVPGIVYAGGDVFTRNRSHYKIGFTMLEVDRIPLEWVQQCNAMNEVWVPSQYNVDTFKASGVHKPIHIIPLGINPNYFHPQIPGSRFTEKFTFLSVFTWIDRKNPQKLLEAFSKAFADEKDVLLVCKITNDSPHLINVSQEINKLQLGNVNSKILILLDQKIPSHLMGSLYRSADCFVLPTRGEGWGMPLLEAMACGIPVIATDYSAQKVFLNQDTGYPIKVKHLIPATGSNQYKHSQWAEPDIDHLIELMRYVYENRDIAMKKSLMVSETIRSQWTWDNTAIRIKNRLGKLL